MIFLQALTKINLDFLRPTAQVIVSAKQNDKASRFIQANLWVGNLPFVPGSALATFRVLKPDGTAAFYDTNESGDPAIVINGNVATIELVEQVLTVPGDVEAELNLYTADGEKLTSFTFTIRVQASVLNDAEISSSDYFNVLTNTLTQAQAAADRAQAAADRAEDLSSGVVRSVNGQTPDENGNVVVQAGVTSVFGREGDVTAQTGDYNVSQITGAVRPNLLDNWYFGNPVNQRGQTEYDGVGAYPYAFDRWIARGSVLTLVDGGVEIGTGGAQVNNIALQTSIENTENLVGKKVTISFLISENNATNDTYVGIFYGASSVNMTLWALRSAAIPAGATGLFSATGVLPDMGTHKAMNPCLRVQGTQSGSLKVTAAKLEIGEGQTLAHQDADGNWVLNEIPDYAEELAKCQRYQVIMSGLARYRTILVQANSLDFYIPTPVTMRAVPAFSVPTARITSFTSSASFSDATWSVVNINPAGVYLRATKNNHGFTDARADLEGGAIFDANL